MVSLLGSYTFTAYISAYDLYHYKHARWFGRARIKHEKRRRRINSKNEISSI